MTVAPVALAWITTVVICLALGVVSWRATRPFGRISVRGWRGRQDLSRWFIWAPSSLLFVAGAGVAFHSIVTHRIALGDLGLGFPLFWLGMITLMQIRLLIATKIKLRGDQKKGDQ